MNPLEQNDVIESFSSLTSGPWTVLRDSWHTEKANGGYYSGIADATKRSAVLTARGWALTETSGAPGFSQHWNSGRTVTTYFSGPANDEGVEPLVLVRRFHGVTPDYCELEQQFRLFHDLAAAGDGNLYKYHDDGTKSVAVKFDQQRVSVRTRLLRQYMAARQMELILFVDSVRFGDSNEQVPDELLIQDELQHIHRVSSDQETRRLSRPFTRLLGTRVVAPTPIESCGVWPFENEAENYPEFIIGQDIFGEPMAFTCNPDKLANYFGANPDAPHYLTPVHFRRDVLTKYYDNPELYTVGDGYLDCAGLWSIRLDNDLTDRVTVFLGDIGRDLPSRERDYWRGFMIEPDSPISKTNYKRSFLNLPTEPASLDLAFRSTYTDLQTSWERAFGWNLYHEPNGADAYLLQRLRLPLNESDEEFETAIRIATKLLVDSLNEKAIIGALKTRVPDEKGISKFQRLLTSLEYSHVERDIGFLRRLQDLRSKVAAHLRGSRYEEALKRNLGSLRGREAVQALLSDANEMMSGLIECADTNHQSIRERGEI